MREFGACGDEIGGKDGLVAGRAGWAEDREFGYTNRSPVDVGL